MRPKHIADLLDVLITSEVPEGELKDTVLLIGKPGCGKTSLAKQAAKRNNYYLASVSQKGDDVFQPLFAEPVDLTGVPHVHLNGKPENAKTYWAGPGWVPTEVPEGYSGVMICIDEMTQCDSPMQKACAPICEEHRIGASYLPKGSIVVATGNRAGDRAGAQKLLSHVKSRVCEIPLDDSLEDFEDWGIESGKIIPEVRYYLRFKPSSLNTFDPSSEQQYASQRGWQKVSKVYPILPEHLRHQTIIGLVGAAGNEFLAFAKTWEELTVTFNVENILKAPEKAAVPKRDQVDILWSLVGSIAEHVKDKELKVLENAYKYFQRLPAREFLFVGVQHTIAKMPPEKRQRVYASKEFQKFFEANRELLNVAAGVKS